MHEVEGCGGQKNRQPDPIMKTYFIGKASFPLGKPAEAGLVEKVFWVRVGAVHSGETQELMETDLPESPGALSLSQGKVDSHETSIDYWHYRAGWQLSVGVSFGERIRSPRHRALPGPW